MPLLTWSYWFNLQAMELTPWIKTALFVAFGLLFVLGIVAAAAAARNPGRMFLAEGGKRFSSLALWMGAFGLVLVFCTHELVYFFGARFWYPLWLIVFLVVLARWIKFVLVDIPEKKADYEEKARIEKWLPKHKK